MKNTIFTTNNTVNKTNTNTTNSKGVKTMKKTSIFKKIIAGVLSAITVFSVGTVALTSASAAETGVVESVKYKGNTIYYSDDYFRHSSTEYDEHLATLSCIMTNFSVPLDNPSSLDSDWYLKQPERLYGFFGSIGFKDFETNEDYVSRSRFDSIGVGCANKQVDDYTVIGVGIRSGGYFREWSNNVYLGDGTKSDYMHEGWYNAANTQQTKPSTLLTSIFPLTGSPAKSKYGSQASPAAALPPISQQVCWITGSRTTKSSSQTTLLSPVTTSTPTHSKLLRARIITPRPSKSPAASCTTTSITSSTPTIWCPR